MGEAYKYKNCQSLFGYAREVHKRYNCICQLCGCGGNQLSDFDIWRQMTVEHLIGQSQGGYQAEIRDSVAERFPKLSHEEREDIVRRLNEANTVTSCRFCNSTTSRAVHTENMHNLILKAGGTPEAVVNRCSVK